ncbi:MAG: hypothetical protein R3E89_00640 [Thiolinea sp.]
MSLTSQDLDIIHSLDDGSLFAEPEVVSALFRYPHMRNALLLRSYDACGRVNGYLPVGQYYANNTLTYIAAMPNSPPISPTYPPGAGQVLRFMVAPYFDTDLVTQEVRCRQVMTASAYGLPLSDYLQHLSTTRRKDMRRKLKKAQDYDIYPGTLQDVRMAWPWMTAIWDQRDGRFGSVSYADYLELTLDWLQTLQHSQRTVLKIDRYQRDGRMVGVNCCVLHHYQGRMHCDDYLTWYDPQQASGLGIVSAVRNITHPRLYGYRYNLGNPGINGVHSGHAYKLAIIPPVLRLTQGVLSLPAAA